MLPTCPATPAARAVMSVVKVDKVPVQSELTKARQEGSTLAERIRANSAVGEPVGESGCKYDLIRRIFFKSIVGRPTSCCRTTI